MEKGKVLFVDDDASLCQLSKKFLGDENYEVNTATNGKNALEILRELNIDVVITDLNMPVMGGNDLLNVIKNDYPSTEIIIITAMPTVDSVINILKSGASDYIVKPINFDLLLTNLKKIFDKKELLSKLNTEKVLKEKISSLLDDYQDLFISTIKSLSEAIEAKDIHTQGHCERISNNSIAIAKKLSLHFDEIRDIQFAALLHDVGKIAIPESILLKPAKLAGEEFEIVKTHPLKGVKILQHIKQLGNAILGIKYHHERFDGKGYPEGLSGKDIPLIARIISICDSYDAMTSNRPYRKALDKSRAYQIIRQEKGKQFDPDVADIFLELNF